MRRLSIASLMLTLVLTGAAARQEPPAAPAFHLHLLGHDIGRETVTRSPDGRQVQSAFHYDDRGAAIDLAATLELAPDATHALAPVHLVVKGKTYRYFSSDTEVTVEGGAARVRDGASSTTQTIAGKPFFPLDGYAPIAVHEELIRYWLTHGRPAEIMTAPAGPVRISARPTTPGDARTKSTPPGRERLSIAGAVWGTETAWIDRSSSRLVALTTWAGALPFEAIRDDAESEREAFIAAAVADRLDDLAALTAGVPSVQQGDFAIRGATVVDGIGGIIPDAAIVIRAGRIAAVGPAARTPIPASLPIVNAAGMTIVPGLWDAHAHASQVDWAPVYLASGVTTIRDMGGETAFVTAFRDAIASGRALGPRVLAAGLVDGPGARAFGSVWASTPDEGRAVVRAYQAAGFQEMKIYSLVAPDVVKAIADEAHARGLLVTGHVPNGMNARSAVEAGFDQIAHMPISGQPESAAVKDLIAFFVEHHTAIDPTQSWNEYLNHPIAAPIASFQPDVARLPGPLGRMILSTPGSAADPAAARARLLQSLQLVHEAQAAGVAVMAGTDKGIPGFSVQREIELYVQGGMSALEAIQAATIVPARVLKVDADTGSIEAGKRADLLVLAANPLTDISNIRAGKWVVVNGRLFDCARLWQAAGYAAPGAYSSPRRSPTIR